MGEAELSTEVLVMWWVSVWRVGWVAGFAQDSVDISVSGKHREWQQAVCSLHFRFYLNQAHAAAQIHPLPAWKLRSKMACLECYSNFIRLTGSSRYQTTVPSRVCRSFAREAAVACLSCTSGLAAMFDFVTPCVHNYYVKLIFKYFG